MPSPPSSHDEQEEEKVVVSPKKKETKQPVRESKVGKAAAEIKSLDLLSLKKQVIEELRSEIQATRITNEPSILPRQDPVPVPQVIKDKGPGRI